MAIKCTRGKEVVLLVCPKSCSEPKKELLVWRDIPGHNRNETGQTNVRVLGLKDRSRL